MFTYTKAFSSFSVNDLQKAKEFYGDILGLEITEIPEGLDVHIADGGKLFIYPKPNHTPATFTVFNFSVENIDAAINELSKQGVQMEQYDLPAFKIKTDEKGIARGNETISLKAIAWFKDPAGNVLAVMQEK